MKSYKAKEQKVDYSDYGSPTKTFSGIKGMSPMDASIATTFGAKNIQNNVITENMTLDLVLITLY